MKFIRNLNRRPIGKTGRLERWALFECQFCGEVQEIRKTNGLKKQSCGCIRGLDAPRVREVESFFAEAKGSKVGKLTESQLEDIRRRVERRTLVEDDNEVSEEEVRRILKTAPPDLVVKEGENE